MTTDATPRDHAAVRLGATEVASLTLDGAVAAVMRLASSPGSHLVVTPNVDHLVLLEHDAEFAAAYARASLRVVDGAPLVLLARLLGTPVPGRITGVDLTLAVLAAAEREQRSVFFFGGEPTVLEGALRRLRQRNPRLLVAGAAAPAVDLDMISPEEDDALAAIRRAAPDLLVVFLGAPKQEKWFWRRAASLPPTVALSVGGTVDFIAETTPRAPRWVQSVGLEWLWRLSREPRRLAHRYLVRDPEFLWVAAKQLDRRYRLGHVGSHTGSTPTRAT